MIKNLLQSNKIKTYRALSSHAAIALSMLIVVLTLNACGKKNMININQLDPPWVESREVKFDPQNPRHIGLAKIFESLDEPWQVVHSRYFISTGQRPTWDAVRHFVEGKLNEQGHFKMMVDEMRNEGNSSFPIVIFSSGWINREYIAVAMDYEPIDGQWLLGYFILEK